MKVIRLRPLPRPPVEYQITLTATEIHDLLMALEAKLPALESDPLIRRFDAHIQTLKNILIS